MAYKKSNTYFIVTFSDHNKYKNLLSEAVLDKNESMKSGLKQDESESGNFFHIFIPTYFSQNKRETHETSQNDLSST